MVDFASFLTGTPWANWHIAAITGDASDRSYARLTGPDGHRVIVMHSGQVLTEPFCAIAEHLADNGFCAPAVLHRQGPVLVLSDLGAIDLATALDQGGDPMQLYRAAVDVLIALRRCAMPDLPRLTPDMAGEMVRITASHYAQSADGDALAEAVRASFEHHAPQPETLALRDFHVENLIWRPNEASGHLIGLLDFQDAFVAPDGYDLASLLRDVRRVVPDNVVQAMTAHYCAATGLDPGTFTSKLACLGAQRNLRILGVFARLINDGGKPKYRALMQRVWQNLLADLAHPALSDLRQTVIANLPPPDQAGFA